MHSELTPPARPRRGPGPVPGARSRDRSARCCPEVFSRYRDAAWIGNPRNVAEEAALRVIASMAGFEPRLEHHADSLELVEDLIAAGAGIGLLPAGRPVRDGLAILPLREPSVALRTFAWTREGQRTWPPLAVILDYLRQGVTEVVLP